MKLTSIYESAFKTLVLNLQFALKDEYLKSEEINGALQSLNELIVLSSSKRVVARYDGYGDSSIPNGAYLFYTYHCPNERCNEVLDVDIAPNYCPRCGQRLRWRGEDE